MYVLLFTATWSESSENYTDVQILQNPASRLRNTPRSYSAEQEKKKVETTLSLMAAKRH